MVLLAMLAALGVIFYMFSAQERKSAEFYSEAAKAQEYDLSIDAIMDFGLEQLIVGPNPRYRNSALFGRRHSLIPNMMGMSVVRDPNGLYATGLNIDLTPFNGVPFDPAGIGTYARDALYQNINDSPAANGGNEPNYLNLADCEPDYTYPDSNNVYLSYQGYEPMTGKLIIIPSFHRPQTTRLLPPPWYADTTSPQQFLRPHLSHVSVPPPGQQFNSGALPSRFLTDVQAVALWGATAKGFPFLPNDQNANGVNDQGVWAAVPTSTYEFDVDNDGDGVREGVWLDLDFPVQEDITGKQYVIMYSMTVVDADALLNLNVHGNLARVWSGDIGLTASAGTPFWISLADPSVSKSNVGVLPSEVNPMWGLNRRPVGVLNDGTYNADGFYGTVSPIRWQESANRELGFLLLGRYTSSPTDLVPGRWGEASYLYNAIANSTARTTNAFSFDTVGNPLSNPWPGPGQTVVDDNGDVQQAAGGFYGSTFTPFGHPMDYTGLGNYYSGKIANYGSSSVSRWPSYNRYSNGTPSVSWPAMANAIQSGLFNDGAEVVVDADNLRPEDSQFGPDEMRALFMNSTDFASAAGGSSRLTSLAPFNLDATVSSFPTSGKNAQLFRSKFTTRSWDRKEFSVPYNFTYNSTTAAFISARPWEFTADSNGNGYLEFPPLFGSILGAEYTPTDLFRPVTRALLETELDSFNQARRSMRLSANALLVGPNGNPYPTVPTVRPPNIDLFFRPLTPHPDPTLLTNAPITTTVSASHSPVQSSYPANGNFGTDYALQEYWARCDRQLLARDIFSLLYTMGWPDGMNPGRPYTPPAPVPTIPTMTFPISSIVFDTSSSGVLDKQMVRQMAQFAVNLVDSLDRDNIPTRFEYPDPTNLTTGTGYNLDDDPYTTSETGRGEVWGVERLDLTLSEALVVTSPQQASDVSSTQWNESTGAQNFAYVELRNPGPNDVDLSTKAWQVEVGPAYEMTAAAAFNQIRRLKLLSGTIASGTLFTIGSADRTVGGANPSVMKVAHNGAAPGNWDADLTTWIAPPQPPAPAAPRPLNLDLKNPLANGQFNLLDATGNAPATGALFDSLSSTNSTVYVRLFRRANPTRPAPTTGNASQEADNPFVMVDQIVITNVQTDTRSSQGGTFKLLSADTQAIIETCLTNLQSFQTREPFYGVGRTTHPGGNTANAYYANTLAADNTPTTNAVPAYFIRWQKVFDRDFASLLELPQLTMGGFSNTTDLNTRFTNNPGDPNAAAISVPGDALTGEDFFMKPSNSAFSTLGANRWYRMLELVEVPTREHVGIPGFKTALDFPRVPGKINLNTMRHSEVLAALLDDPSVMSVFVDEDFNLNGTLDAGEDLNGNGNLDSFNPPLVLRTDLTVGSPSPYTSTILSWWQGFLQARDGYRSGSTISGDTTSGGLYLPGTYVAGSSGTESRPFRSFTSATRPTSTDPLAYTTVENTVFRAWPDDAINTDSSGTNDPRQLFELGTLDERLGHDNSAPTPAPVAQIDPYVRRRLMSKLMNNTTTRSNVFVVFMSVKNFRADVSTGSVRIGGPLSGNAWDADHRGFFVIDRSQLEKAYDPSTNSFNFRSFIEFRQIIQ